MGTEIRYGFQSNQLHPYLLSVFAVCGKRKLRARKQLGVLPDGTGGPEVESGERSWVVGWHRKQLGRNTENGRPIGVGSGGFGYQALLPVR
jgi:hypothetical protein